MANGRTRTAVGLAVIVACVFAAPVAAEETMDLEQMLKSAIEGMKNPPEALKNLKVAPAATRPAQPEQFGVPEANTVIPNERFHEFPSVFPYSFGASGFYYEAASDTGLAMAAPLELPAGTQITDLCTFWHDTETNDDPPSDITDGVTFLIATELADVNAVPSLAVLTGNFIGDIEAPGYTLRCASVQAPTSLPITVRGKTDLNSPPDGVERWTSYYILMVEDFSSQLDVSFGGVLVKWKRLITPDPAVATFGDVPIGDAAGQHRYVEALVAAGITAGCQASPPLYCPNAPLTRGQMAVFLSRIVGLWWPF